MTELHTRTVAINNTMKQAELKQNLQKDYENHLLRIPVKHL
jgi:hypothetical protein